MWDSSFNVTDIDAVNKLYVEQRVKILTNQQKESDERLTPFEKDVADYELQHVIIKIESEITMTTINNERQWTTKRWLWTSNE